MEIICTPSHGALALIVDISSGKVVREVSMPAEMLHLSNRPFGIARTPTGDWMIASNNAIAYLDKNLTLKHLVAGLPENIHQLFCDPMSQKLWVMATSVDSVLTIDMANNKGIQRFCLITDQWVPLDAPGNDTQHFNSITWYEDHCHIVAHKFGKSSSVVRTYNRQMKRISMWQAGRQAHNIIEYAGQMFLLSSQGGCLVGNQGTNIQVCDPDHYARGMVISPDGIATVAVFDFGNRNARNTGDAWLRSFDLQSGKQINEILLSGVGNIQDIQWWRQE